MEYESELFNMRKSAVLTIGMSDSGGNSGVQADWRAFQSFGVHACTAVTAIAAQNVFGSQSVAPVEPELIGAQLDAVIEPYGVMAIKTGVLPSEPAIDLVADRLGLVGRIAKIVDPELVAPDGIPRLSETALSAFRTRILPLAFLATPNLSEAELLDGSACESERDMPTLARRLADRFSCAVLLKSGQNLDHPADDFLCDGESVYRVSTPAVDSPVSVTGAGGLLSAAIAAAAACGRPLLDAVAEAKAYVYEALRTAIRVGEAGAVTGSPAHCPADKVRIETINA